ncbi:MAG: zf-HC2 domain-containing protein, partial [Planctomycetota bacterium]
MANCKFDRSVLDAWLDGESTAEEESLVLEHLDACDDCRAEVDRSASALATFLALSPGGPPISIPEETPRAAIDDDGPPDEAESAPRSPEAVTSSPSGAIDDDGPPEPVRPMPSVDFTARVMAAIREEEEERETAPVTAAAPSPATPQAPRPATPAPILRPWSWAVAAGIAVAVFAGMQLMKKPVVVPEPGPGPSEDREVAVVDPRGGVMRWSGPVDRLLEGSTWVQPDGELLPGEVLHSTGNATPHVRLPEGGRILARPSSWLAYGGESTIALLDGAVTAFAAESGDVTLNVDTPMGRIATRGELEVSILAPDPRGEVARKWLGNFSRPSDTGRTAPEAPPPANVAALVFARKGPARIRMSEARGGLREIPEGYALVVLEGGVFEVKAGSGEKDLDQEAGGSWMNGLPQAPESKFGFGAAASPGVDDDAPPSGPEVGGGPVRNTLERALADPDPEKRARALVVLQDLGGAEAIALAAKMTSDASIMVRSAAMRVVALNSLDDLDAALPALRVFAGDEDAGVAVSAIRAIKFLKDTGSIEVLTAMAEDAGRPAVLRAHAVRALVDMGGEI